MRTPYGKSVIFTIGVLSLLFFSSFRHVSFSTTGNTKEYLEVRKFIWEVICVPLAKELKDKPAGSSKEMFSRCPSGYQPVMTAKVDSISSNRFIDGRIVYYRGCAPIYICDFKVNVSKGFAVVKTRGSTNYMGIGDWIKMKNEAPKSLVKG